MNIVEIAKNIAEEAHKNQYRNDGITPYMDHIEGVVEILKNTHKTIEIRNEYSLINDEVLATAYLHDTLEDTSVTEEMLREKMPYRVIEAVRTLTRKKEQPYDDYMSNVAMLRIARLVKIADMLHNLTSSPSKNQKARYIKGIAYLSM
jgi:(p)ppGpp synthase/HD superfamily hydrolase